MNSFAVGVATPRDAWDWLVLWLTVAGATTALFAFGSWLLERRRRPELLVIWEYAADGNERNLERWEADTKPTLLPGQKVTVRHSIKNVGDAAAERVLTNFVVPACLDLSEVDEPESKLLTTVDRTVGVKPQFKALFMARTTEQIAPGDAVVRRYTLSMKDGSALTESTEVRIALDAACARLNPRGHRRIPSFIYRLDDAAGAKEGAGTKWPPDVTTDRVMRWVHAMPRGRLLCRPGSRKDVRDLTLHP